MRRGRIAPADAEHLNAVVEQEADHAFVGRQIQCVIFVDLRRGDDQRPLSHIRRRRCVLYQLQQFVAEHHPARRGRQAFADLEGALIDHRRHAAILGEIVEVVLQPGPHALAAAVHEFTHRRRIGQHGIGRRHRIDQDFRDQMRPRLVDVAQACLVDKATDGIAPGQIGLEHPAMHRTLFPGGVGKPFVARPRRTLGAAGDDGAEFAQE
jgi:hypothetical protein